MKPMKLVRSFKSLNQMMEKGNTNANSWSTRREQMCVGGREKK